jgi:hypothetical protein
MSTKLIEPGTYTARIADYGVSTTNAGSPQIVIKFAFKDPANQERYLTWFGNLSEKAIPFTMKALAVCGLSKDLEYVADGPDGGALDTLQEVSIVVAQENDLEGHLVNRVQWVNRLGGSVFRNALTRQDAKVRLGAINWKGQLAQAKKDLGLDQTKKTQTAPAYADRFDQDANEDYQPGF